jgi:hypothetical protein
MNRPTRKPVARLLSAGLLGLAIFAWSGSVAHGAALNSSLAGRLVTEDPPADDSGSTDDGTDSTDDSSDDSSSDDDPEPEPSAPASSQAPSAPAPSGDSQSDRDSGDNDSSSESDSSSETEETDKAGVPISPSLAPSPEPTDPPTPRRALVTEHGPSPLGWVLLAAGLAFLGSAGAFYLRNRPFSGPDAAAPIDGLAEPDAPGLVEGPGVIGEPESVTPPDLDTEELDAIPSGGPDALEPDTEEMLVVPLGVDAPRNPQGV